MKKLAFLIALLAVTTVGANAQLGRHHLHLSQPTVATLTPAPNKLFAYKPATKTEAGEVSANKSACNNSEAKIFLVCFGGTRCPKTYETVAETIQSRTRYINVEDIIATMPGAYQKRSGDPVQLGGGR